ncbi:DUF6904 family protein [Kiloniella litopenaei]|uniref:DUF6904 family protein n=1 Tax=Kiloniella litopenaei TaxID=1549748 RepID=UPI000695C355|nr:hypothetical protein [Kiloniella litopenaei]
MLRYELTKKHAGIILWGDPWTLNDLFDFIHRINEESSAITNKESFMISLAYDVRKAYQREREVTSVESFEDSYKLYGVKIIWPVLLLQISVLRNAMGFLPTTRSDQAIMFDLESTIEAALKKAIPNDADKIFELLGVIGSEKLEHLEKIYLSKCKKYVSLSTRQRLKTLLPLLQTMSSSYNLLSKHHENNFDFDEHRFDWPKFDW